MTDYRAKALRLVKVDNECGIGWETADAQHLANLAEAQMYATLAVAEQQRIANLIAWVSLPDAVTCAETLPFDKKLAAPVTQRNEVRRAIREGLGL